MAGGFEMRDGLGEMLARARETVLRGMAERMASYPAGLRMALENVDPANGFSTAAPGADPDALLVFACASVGMHTDEGNVPRWSEIACLGPLDPSAGASHSLHAGSRKSPWDDIDAWNAAGGPPEGALGEVASRVLVPGDCFLLDGHMPHWLGVSLGGRERGAPFSACPDLNAPCPGLVGVPPEAVAGLFVSYSSDAPLGREGFLRVLDGLEFMAPSPSPGRVR